MNEKIREEERSSVASSVGSQAKTTDGVRLVSRRGRVEGLVFTSGLLQV